MLHSTRRTSRTILLSACASLLMLSGMAPRVLAQETGVNSNAVTVTQNNQALFGYGITENRKGVTKLVAFSLKKNRRIADGQAKNIGKINGLQTGERILGIDFRPLNGQLYALGSSSRLYTIDLRTARATAVGAQFAIPLSGTFFGFDFNPTVDRIRVVSDADQNLRINPITGAVVDSDADASNGLQGDGNLNFGNNTNPFIAGAAYTNPDNDPNTGTTLYYIDSAQDTLVISPAPNAGSLTTVGRLGVDVSVPLSFDISLQNGVNFALATFATFNSRNRLAVATINLETGAATILGRVNSNESLTGFAFVPNVNNNVVND